MRDKKIMAEYLNRQGDAIVISEEPDGIRKTNRTTGKRVSYLGHSDLHDKQQTAAIVILRDEPAEYRSVQTGVASALNSRVLKKSVI